MRKHTRTISVTLLAAVLAACTAKDPLDGSIPKCEELVSVQRKPYVELAKERCEQARSFEEKMKSVGCGIKDQWRICKQIQSLH